MKNKKWISLATAVVLAVTALPLGVFAAKKDEAKLAKVTLNEVAHSIFYAPQYVAIEEGYFKDEGLDMTLITGFGADKTMTAVISGEADIGFMGAEASIYAYQEGATDPVVNFAQLTQRAGNFLVAREEMPDFKWEDLKGRKVLGGRKGGMPEMVFEYILKQNGLDPQKDLSIDQSIDFGSMENLLLALFVLVVILIFKHWTTGFLSSSAILIGILAGYVAAFVMGLVLPTTGVTADGVEFTKAWVLNWNKVAQASWFAIPKLMPVKIVFDMRAIMPVMIMFVVTAVETVGDISGVMEGGMNREPTDKELSGGVICDGLGSSFAALFGVLPNTSFSQNVGLVAMTKVVNRMALASGAIFLILCGLIPKLGALISIMPQAVLGGAAVMMFSSIVVSGIQLITKEKMTPRQLTIVSVALGVGYGMGANSGILAQAPHAFQLICGESGIVPAAFVAILLNVLLPKDDKAV